MEYPPGAQSAEPLAPASLDGRDQQAIPQVYEKLYAVFADVPTKYKDVVKGMTGEELRKEYYHSLLADDPDKIWQRFVRHHEFDIEKAFTHFLACLYWRARVKRINDELMREGDVQANEIVNGKVQASVEEKKDAAALVDLFKKGEIYCHGKDKKGRVICWINVGKHTSQKQEVFERYMLYHIETPRFLIPNDGWNTLLVFDMSGAGLRQMETQPLKSFLEFFDKYYPWGVANVVAYNAPWVFGGLWKVIKNWIPGKDAGAFVAFAKNAKEVEEHIDRSLIPKSMGGDDTWQYQYTPGDLSAKAAKTKDTAGREAAIKERLDIATKLEELTKKWIDATKAGEKDVSGILREREAIIKQLRVQYWTLDPYVRARGLYDDWGAIEPVKAKMDRL